MQDVLNYAEIMREILEGRFVQGTEKKVKTSCSVLARKVTKVEQETRILRKYLNRVPDTNKSNSLL